MEEGEKWKNMEADCLVSIFKKLSLQDLTLGVSLVCSSWYKASLDPVCWQILDFQEVDFMRLRKFTTDDSVSAFFRFAVRRSRGFAAEVWFPPFLRPTLKEMVVVSNECPRLKIVVMRSLRSEDEVHLPKIIGKWKELEHLEMSSNPSSFPAIAEEISLNCENFNGLKMSGLRKVDAFAITKYLPKIRYLNLSRSYMPKETLLLIMNSCKEIEILVVTHCVGFKIDKEIQDKASGIKFFRHEGSMEIDDPDYDSDDCFPSCMFPYDSDEYPIGIRWLPIP